MKRRHIAMFTLLNPGHVWPMLDICAELAHRGYRVTYPVPEMFSEKVSATGAEPVAFKVPRLMNAEKVLQFPRPGDPKFWPLYAAIICPQLLAVATATVAEFEEFYRATPPDLIIYDLFSFGGHILAKRLGCPKVQVWSHFAHQDFLVREEGVCKNPEPIGGFVAILKAFMSSHGVEDQTSFWYTDNVNIYFHPREFQFDAHLFDQRSHFVGPCLNRTSQQAWKNNSGGKPVILISESSAMRDSTFFHLCAEAFADSEYHVVFSVGANTPPIGTDMVPTNFEINKHTYNIDILPHAAAFVSQSGMGVALESLYFAVPMVALPPNAFNAEVAYRVEELGLGTYLRDSDLSPHSLRASVSSLIADKGMRQRLNTMQNAVRNAGGAKLAVNLIEKTLNA
jgi:MGT family glycosyltransferase